MKKLCPGVLLLLLAAPPLPALQAPADRTPSKPTPSPTPAPFLEGTVKGPEGKPVEGALVIARSTVHYSDPLLSAQTDAGGRFRLALRRPVPYIVRVEAKGLAGATVDKARPGTPLAVTLTRGAVLEGTVRDGTTGQPVPGARVEARDDQALSLPWEPTAGVAQATTDAKGRFRLAGLTSAPQTVSARGAGAGSGRKTGALPGRPFEIYLFPGATLSGTVWGPGDLRVAGAVVRVESDTPGFRTMPPPAITDTQGRYEIGGLSPGTYRVMARHKDFAPDVVGGVTVERGGDAQADISLEKGTALVGRLVAGPEQWVAGRVSIQELDGRPAPAVLREVLRAEAGADGRFRLETVPAGAHVIGVVAPGYASKRVDVHVRPAAREVDVGEVELESGLTIRGRVRDRAGPIAGATLRALPQRSRLIPNPSEGLSEADGSFVVGGLEPGAYRLSVSAPGYSSLEKPAEAGAERVDLVLSPGGSIAGAVVDDAGRPVESFLVSANPVRDERMEPGVMISGPRGRSASGADGRFLIEDLGEGTYVVDARAVGRSNAHVSGVKVTAGSTTDAGTIRLSAGGTVRGTVADSAGAAVPGAVISVRGLGRSFMAFGAEPQGVSDPTGAFEVTGVPPGTVEVVAAHPNYAEGRVSGIEVDPAKGASDARIVLSQGGRIEGWVRRRDGTGVAGAYVNVGSSPGAGMGPRSGPGMLVTSADGGFVAEHVPVGRATVTLMVRSGPGYASAQFQDVEVREGETTPVELRSRDILVSGRVTRSGAPLPGVRLTLRAERMMMMMFGAPGGEVAAVPSGPQRMTAVTGEDGGYEMIAEQPGRAHLMVERVDGKGGFPGRTVDLPDADAYALDLAFAGVTLSGIVVDQDREQPVARAFVSAAPIKPDPNRPGLGFGSGAHTGEDGRFQIDVEPGDYRVWAGAEGYGRSEVETSVGSGGGDVRLAIARGLTLAGRVVDGRGNGVAGLNVFARASGADGERESAGGASTLPDGSFQVGGLKALPHRVTAHSDLGAFATRDGVRPGDKDVVLILRPGGRVTVHVVGPEGQPVEGAWASIVDAGMGSLTDARGMAEVMAPAGTVELRARKDRLEGRATVTVAERGLAAAEITLGPPTRVSHAP